MSEPQATEYETILVKREKAIVTITLNRPDKMNSLNDQILYDLQHAMSALETDETVRAVILTGAGRAFCAGFDLSPREVPFKTVEHWREHVILGNDTLYKFWRSRLPVIAAVNGFCLGGGCDLSMVCDITIASTAAEFGEPEVQFQSSAPFAILPWIVGIKQAKEMLLIGGRVDAAEAHRIGLVNRVVEPDALMVEARKVAVQLAKVPAVAVKFNKRVINHAYEIAGFHDAIEYGAEMFTMVKMSESSAEQQEFFRVVREKGLKAAFKWRDETFARENDGLA